MSFICEPSSVDEVKDRIKQSREAETAGAFAGTGIPVLDSVLEDLTQALGSLASAGMGAVISQTQQSIQDSLTDALGPLAASAVANVTALLNVASEAQLVAMGAAVENLKRQAHLRTILLRELIFHTQGIMSILNRIDKGGRTERNPRIRQAYPYVLKAYTDLTKLRTIMRSSRPRFNRVLFRTILLNIDYAIDILNGTRNRSLSSRFFADLRKDKLKAVGQYLLDGVIAEYAMLAEIYLWHLANLGSISVGGYVPPGFGLTTLGINKNVPGVSPKYQDELKHRQALYNTQKQNWFNEMAPPSGPLKDFLWIDANKGLIATHEVAKTSARLLLNFETDWETLSASARSMWVTLSPSHGILGSVEETLRNALTRDPAKLDYVTSTMIEPLLLTTWATAGLTSAKDLLASLERSGFQFESVAEDFEAWEAIKAYLQSDTYADGIDAINTILKLLVSASAFALTGPLNRRILQKARILFNEIRILAHKGLSQDTQLLQILNRLRIMDNPLLSALGEAVTGLAGQSSAAAAILSQITSGNLGAVSGMFNGIVQGLSITTGAAATVDLATDLYDSIFGECETTKQDTAITDPRVKELLDVEEDRQNKIAKAAEVADDAPTESWYDSIGSTASEFYLDGLSL